MNENGFEFEENDFGDLCGLADIFPDIEPYLEDVTNSYEIAKADIKGKKTEGHIDGSDSDSGISADSYANGILKNIDSSLTYSLISQDKLTKPIKVTSTINSDQKFVTNIFNENNKILIKRPISFVNKITTETKSIYNINPQISDSNYPKSKSIFLKSQPCIKYNDNNKKMLTKPISKLTPVKLLKTNEGFPVVISDIKKNDKSSFYETQNSNTFQQMKRNDNILETVHIKNEMDSRCMFSLDSKSDNIFLKDDIMNTQDDISLISNCHINDIFDNKNDVCADISSIDDFKSQNGPSYLDLYNSSQCLGNKALQTSMYNTLNNCDGILDAHHYDRMVKKQERMIKNRQAASLSRQRKKEYVERLEHKVEQQKQETHFVQNQINDMRERFCALEQENLLLKRDIQTWRERYYDLERQKIKQGIITTNKHHPKSDDINNKNKALKATAVSTTILGIFIICTFNFNFMNSSVSTLYKTQNEKDIPIYKSNYPVIQNSFLGKKILGRGNRLSRTLFSIVENSSDVENENLGNLCNNTGGGLNFSETLRLTRELNRWGSRFKAESVKVYDRLQNEKIKSQILSKEMESMYKKSKNRDIPTATNKMKRRRDSESGELEIYPKNNDYGYFDSFINDIDRKPDTLYFVTFHSDNLIFPASNTNKNLSTPKITLFLPAYINQQDKNVYKMMKIDCQVQNFTIVNLKKVKLP